MKTVDGNQQVQVAKDSNNTGYVIMYPVIVQSLEKAQDIANSINNGSTLEQALKYGNLQFDHKNQCYK